MATKDKKLDPAHFSAATDNPVDRIIVQGIHVEITAALRSIILEKFTPLLNHESRALRLHVNLRKDQRLGGDNVFSVTGRLEVSGPDLHAHADDKDAYVALDKLVEKLDHLLERRHDRRKDKRNHPHGVEIPADLPKV